jgi:hypothetical protein
MLGPSATSDSAKARALQGVNMQEPRISRAPAVDSHGDSLASPTEEPSVLAQRTRPAKDVYTSAKAWNSTRPKTLVVACSDGRLQESIDEFLAQHLGVIDYDRLYAPGGPAILATSSLELLRADQFRREFSFLCKVHAIEQVILLFHGASEDGPEHAACAHYRRSMARASNSQIAQQQYLDMVEILRHSSSGWPQLRVHAFRAEVNADASVHFVELSRP